MDSINDSALDYYKRRLDICGVCNGKYNVGDKIPRILINCGHTYCTACLTKYFRKERIRCPYCRKLVKNLESVEQLPLNINMFSEVVLNDPLLIVLLDSDNEDSYSSVCSIHTEKQKHFFCSDHEVNFCRDCIKLYHRSENCCVVDLFDIKKLFQLNEQNFFKNQLIIKARIKRNKDEFFIANS
jgi:hypothetical protein